jgi:hypothetical protein
MVHGRSVRTTHPTRCEIARRQAWPFDRRAIETVTVDALSVEGTLLAARALEVASPTLTGMALTAATANKRQPKLMMQSLLT